VATKKQLAANRSNSACSTGPVSESGKLVVSTNALNWGVFSRLVLLPDEDGGLFDSFVLETMADLRPVGAVETALADMIVATLWRWRRLHGIEAGLYTMYRQYQGADRGVATAFVHDASQLDSLGKLTRYETALERRTQRLMHELQRLQAARAGQNMPPPQVVDVDIQGVQPDGVG
jgi:hypothetical protein